MKTEEVEAMFLMLMAAYPWFEVPDREIATVVWEKPLRGFSGKLVRAATEEWIAQSEKPPTPADIRKICEGLEETAGKRRRQLTAEEAWEQCVEAARKGFSWQDLNRRFFRREALLRAAKSVGWKNIRRAHVIEQLPFIRKDFLAAYGTFEEVNKKEPVTAEGRLLVEQMMAVVDGSNQQVLGHEN